MLYTLKAKICKLGEQRVLSVIMVSPINADVKFVGLRTLSSLRRSNLSEKYPESLHYMFLVNTLTSEG